MFSQTPRCQIVPLADDQVAFVVDGHERLRWHAGGNAPRPFFFPFTGPSGISLTRMGHPGAPNHDHHRSIWFAHHNVLGIDFWSDTSPARIRQQQWLAYDDGEGEGRMAVRLAWHDGHDPEPLLQQELIAAIAPEGANEILLELQTRLIPTAESLELGQTNFGLLAVRVAKSISAVFGDGMLTGASGRRTEAELFGYPSAWMDYSGSVDRDVVEGITYFDHASNLHYPNRWHVRDDGWMGASVCHQGPIMLRRDAPLTWRYLLHAHAGPVDAARAQAIAAAFNAKEQLKIVEDESPHKSASLLRGPG